MLQFERQLWEKGFRRLGGVDEAGRGPLAGPVVAAVVIFERSFVESEENGVLKGINDSKKLTASRREFFHNILTGSPHVEIGVGIADIAEIDELNILRATHVAMSRAVTALKSAPDYVIVDGLPVPVFPCQSTAIIGGDGKSLSIAAASIIAKVTRDAGMKQIDAMYPQYGFARHKGYGSKDHMQALLEFGPCPAHRKTFRPVRDAAEIRSRSGEHAE